MLLASMCAWVLVCVCGVCVCGWVGVWVCGCGWVGGCEWVPASAGCLHQPWFKLSGLLAVIGFDHLLICLAALVRWE